MQVDLRGFGASSGCNDFGGPGEQADAKAAVEWAASQPWSTGKVGMWGKSYDGWTEVMGLATKPKGLAAAVIHVADHRRLPDALHERGPLRLGLVRHAWRSTRRSTPSRPALFDSPQYFAGAALGTNPACYGLNIVQQTAFIDRDDAVLEVP